MKVILLRDIKNIGKKYQVKDVNDGFARNGLIGKGIALPATPENLGRMKIEMDKVAKVTTDRQELLAKGLKSLEGVEIFLSGKANAEGHLFAAIHAQTIATELEKKTGVKIDKDWLDPKAIKTVGEHEIMIKFGGKTASFKLVIKNN